jgi:hypothetical protein
MKHLRGTCFSLSGERSSPLNFGHSWRPRQVSVRLATSQSTQPGEFLRLRARRHTATKPENFAGRVEASKGELRSLDKLKHVPRKRPNSRGERSSPSAGLHAAQQMLSGYNSARSAGQSGGKGTELSVEVPTRSPAREKRGALSSSCDPARIGESGGHFAVLSAVGRGTRSPAREKRGALSSSCDPARIGESGGHFAVLSAVGRGTRSPAREKRGALSQ